MGLAVVHGIVRGYGGKISVRSTPGEGSTFDVLWPIVEMAYENQSKPKKETEHG